MAAKMHSFVEIQPMRSLSLISGIKMQFVASILSGMSVQPIHESTAISSAALLGIGDEIVDIQYFTKSQELENPEACCGHNGLSFGYKYQPEPIRLLALDTQSKFRFTKMWAQNFVDGIASRDLHFGYCVNNLQ